MTKPLIVSYYTEDPKYSSLAAVMLLKLNELGWDHHIYKYPSNGNWALKSSYKPSCILQAMRGYPGRDIIWIDIDAEPRFLPSHMLEERFDFVVGTYSPWWLVANLIKFSGNSLGVKQILRYWEYNTPRFPRHTDELILTNAWHSIMAAGVSLRYCFLNRIQVAGVSQLNVSDRKDSPSMFYQAHLTREFKEAVTKRTFHKIFTLDEIVFER